MGVSVLTEIGKVDGIVVAVAEQIVIASANVWIESSFSWGDLEKSGAALRGKKRAHLTE